MRHISDFGLKHSLCGLKHGLLGPHKMSFLVTKIKAFFYAAQSKSFTGTRLNLSASVINRHVQDLEHHLGVVLFYRTSKGLILTNAGKILFKVEVYGLSVFPFSYLFLTI